MKNTHLITQIILVVIIIAVALFTYNLLPDQVITHWNIDWQADGRWSKIWLYLWIPATALFIFVLMKFLPKLDPKKEKYELFDDAYQWIQTTLLAFFAYLFAVSIYANLYPTPSMSFFMLIGMWVLFVVIGNFMWKLRQNYFVWIKTPWTLADEHVWNMSHRFGGKLWVIGWVIMIIEAFIMKYITFVMFTTIAILVIAPLIYSYMIYKKSNQK